SEVVDIDIGCARPMGITKQILNKFAQSVILVAELSRIAEDQVFALALPDLYALYLARNLSITLGSLLLIDTQIAPQIVAVYRRADQLFGREDELELNALVLAAQDVLRYALCLPVCADDRHNTTFALDRQDNLLFGKLGID